MEIRINISFLKELTKLPQNQRKKVEDFVFYKLEKYQCLQFAEYETYSQIT